MGKKRTVYLLGRTRVHPDEVESLGEAVELGVVMRPNQTVDEGAAVAIDVMKMLEMASQDLIKGAYPDVLTR